MARKRKQPEPTDVLKGWQQIASFLGQPLSTVQRWGKQGMPITKQGRSVTANPEELQSWLGREIGEKQPARIATPEEDLAADLRASVKAARNTKRSK